jgi:hypothetical protein
MRYHKRKRTQASLVLTGKGYANALSLSLGNTARLRVFSGDSGHVETRNFASLQGFWVIELS